MNAMQMNTEQSPTPPDFVSASLLGKPSADAPAVRPANRKNDRPPAKSSRLGKLPLAFARHLIVLLVGVGATLAWQTYGDAARHMIASTVFSSDQRQPNTMALDLEAMRQSIDGLATSIATHQEQVMRSINDQERIMRSVDQLKADQEQMTREIAKFQALDQFVLFKSPDPAPPPRPAPFPMPKPVLRQSQARTALTPAKNP